MMIKIKTVENVGRNKLDAISGDVYYTPIIDGHETGRVAETEDMAMIVGLAIKYDGLNSQFPRFAARMLGIESEWAK